MQLSVQDIFRVTTVYSISDILNQTSKWDRHKEQKNRSTCTLLGANTLRYPNSNSRCFNYLLCHLPLGFSYVQIVWRGMAYLSRLNLASIATCKLRAPRKGWRGWWFISCTIHQSENCHIAAWTEPWHPRLQSIPTASKSDRLGILRVMWAIADIGNPLMLFFYRVWKKKQTLLWCWIWTKDKRPHIHMALSGLNFEAKFCSRW